LGKVTHHVFLICFILTVSFAAPVVCGEVKRTVNADDTNIIQLNNIFIDKKEKEIRIKAQLAIKEGILEYFLVGNEGKTYESVLKVVDCKPSDLNFALLLIGCKQMNFETMLDLIRDTDGRKKLLKNYKDSLLELEIISAGKKMELQQLMRNRESTTDPLLWVYTGGLFIKDHGYAGDLELSYISVWPDPTTPVNLFAKNGNPYGGDFGFEVNKRNTALKIDQNFEILIRRRQPL